MHDLIGRNISSGVMAFEDILSSTEFAANITVGEECPSQLPTVVQYLNGKNFVLIASSFTVYIIFN